MIKISVIIPVHNGEKYIEKTVKKILSQSFSSFEIILVENFSKDNSLSICNELSKIYDLVRVTRSFEKGTTFARKKGIQEARGEYITFCDQDDYYINKDALKNMYNIISSSASQICQFGFYKKFRFGIKRKSHVNSTKLYNIEGFLKDEIRGIIGDNRGVFNTTVWNKIYETALLKEVANSIVDGLFYAEDEYLNILSFFNKNCKQVSIHPDCFYVWNAGIGFSASEISSIALLDDYEIIKPLSFELMKENNVPEDIIFASNIETVYFCKSIVQQMILNKKDKQSCINTIEEISYYNCLKMAKHYFNNYNDKTQLWDELVFMSSEYSAEEYYNSCLKNMPPKNLKSFISVYLNKRINK